MSEEMLAVRIWQALRSATPLAYVEAALPPEHEAAIYDIATRLAASYDDMLRRVSQAVEEIRWACYDTEDERHRIEISNIAREEWPDIWYLVMEAIYGSRLSEYIWVRLNPRKGVL